MAPKRLLRSRYNGMLGGVCSGIADYFNIDPTIVRLGWIVMSMAYGSGIFAYLICWVVIPEE